MSITIMGFAWVLLFVCIFLKVDRERAILFTMIGMTLQSASVFLLNGNGVGPQLVSSLLFIIFVLWSWLIQDNRKLYIRKWNPCRLLSVLSGFIFILLIRYSGNRATRSDVWNSYFWLIFVYFTCYMVMWGYGKYISNGFVNQCMITVIWFVVIVGLIQILTTTGVLPRNILLETFLFTPDTGSAYYWSAIFSRVFCTFMEPSYAAAFIVGAFYYLIALDHTTKSQKVLTVLLVLEILLTFSSTAYGAFAIGGICYLLISKNKKAMKYLLPIGLMILLGMFVSGQLGEILNKVIFNKRNSGSAYTRGVWDKNALRAFRQEPIFGVGYKSVRGSHLYTSILGQCGIVGTILWIVMILPIVILLLKNKNRENNFTSMLLFLVSVIIAMCIAIPDLDFCVFWMAMYLSALSISTYKVID